MTTPKVPKPTNPVLIDSVIVQIQDTLKEKLSWLDYSFGQAQNMVKEIDGKEFNFPGVHIANGRYENMLPDSKFGNFSFFTVDDPQVVDFYMNTINDITVDCSIIFWVNLDKIFASEPDRNKEAIKAEIIKVLTRELFLKSGRFSFSNIFEKADNIYLGFDISEVESQFLMQPYCGFRFEGKIKLTESCT